MNPSRAFAFALLAALLTPSRWLVPALLALCPTSVFLVWRVLNPFPAWFARTMQSPFLMKVIDEPLIEQISALDGAIENVTARPDVALAVIV